MYFRPPVPLTMALTSARYSHNLLPSVPPPSLPNREPTPTKENSDNDGKKNIFIYVRIFEAFARINLSGIVKTEKRNLYRINVADVTLLIIL
jgi:hypothetical protein